MARASGAPAKREAGGGGSIHWLMGMACGAILAFATPTAILGGVLLAPAILAAVFDTQKKRPMTRVVFVACAGFAFGPVWHLNAMGGVTSQALAERMRQFGHRGVEYAGSNEAGVDAIVQGVAPGDMILTLGAGSVSQLAEKILERLT